MLSTIKTIWHDKRENLLVWPSYASLVFNYENRHMEGFGLELMLQKGEKEKGKILEPSL